MLRCVRIEATQVYAVGFRKYRSARLVGPKVHLLIAWPVDGAIFRSHDWFIGRWARAFCRVAAPRFPVASAQQTYRDNDERSGPDETDRAKFTHPIFCIRLDEGRCGPLACLAVPTGTASQSTTEVLLFSDASDQKYVCICARGARDLSATKMAKMHLKVKLRIGKTPLIPSHSEIPGGDCRTRKHF